MDRETATKLVAKLIAATQSGELSWDKQSTRMIKAEDHATSAVYFGKFGDLGFRIYHYRWKRADYYTLYVDPEVDIEPRWKRGVVLELLDEDGDLIETIPHLYALRDLFEVANQSANNLREKINNILGSKSE